MNPVAGNDTAEGRAKNRRVESWSAKEVQRGFCDPVVVYLLAFIAGSVVGRVIATRWIKRGGAPEEASVDAPDEVSA